MRFPESSASAATYGDRLDGQVGTAERISFFSLALFPYKSGREPLPWRAVFPHIHAKNRWNRSFQFRAMRYMARPQAKFEAHNPCKTHHY